MNLIVFIILISIIISIYILLPFLKNYLMAGRKDIPAFDINPEHKAILREKDRLIDEIKDIDLDYGLEKLGENDYKELRHKYRLKAAKVIKEIESYEKLKNINIDSAASKKIDEEIELIKGNKN